MLTYGCIEKVVKRTISIVISINHPTPSPLYHGGGMNLHVRPREYNINFVGSG